MRKHWGGKSATAFVASDQLKEQVRSELSSQVSSGKVGGKTLNALISGTSTPVPQALSEGPSSFACNLASDRCRISYRAGMRSFSWFLRRWTC